MCHDNDIHLISAGSGLPWPKAGRAVPQGLIDQFVRHSQAAVAAVNATIADLDAAGQVAHPAITRGEQISLTVSTNHLCRALVELERAVLATGMAQLDSTQAPVAPTGRASL